MIKEDKRYEKNDTNRIDGCSAVGRHGFRFGDGRQGLAKVIAKQVGISTEQAAAAVEAFKAAVIAQVKTGEAVRLRGFGKFTMKERKAHKGRNPKTGKSIDIPARNHLRFKAFQGAKDALNN